MHDKIVLLFVEGSRDRVFYEGLFERFLRASRIGIEDVGGALKRYIDRFGRRFVSVLAVEGALVVVINCRGYNGLRGVFRDLLRDEEQLAELIQEGLRAVVLVADADKDLVESTRGIVSSLGLELHLRGDIARITVQDAELDVTMIRQGLERERSTRELEDLVDEIASRAYSRIARAISQLEKHLGGKLDSKQRASIYAAVLVRDKGVEGLIPKLLREASEGDLEIARSILNKLVQAVR